MITEEYVSFEIAKLLKEKGFNELCDTRYYGDDGSIPSYIRERWEDGGDICPMSNSDLDDGSKYADISAPTLQMAMKWLREVHDCPIEILWHWDANSQCSYWYFVHHMELKPRPRIEYYDTYEEAMEAAIKYCLENLI